MPSRPRFRRVLLLRYSMLALDQMQPTNPRDVLHGIPALRAWNRFLASILVRAHGNSHRVAMIESEHKLLFTHKVSCHPCKSKIAKLSWFRRHLTQPFHTELNVVSSTGHVNTDACILLMQLSFHPSSTSNDSRSIFPTSLLPGELCGTEPTLDRFLMITARFFGSSSHSNP